LVHVFCLQTPIKTECSMRRSEATAVLATGVAMATASWRTCWEDDGMRPPKFHPNRSIDRPVMVFPIFSNMVAVRHFEF